MNTSLLITFLNVPKLILTVKCIAIHHHHIALVARISLTLSRHSSLSFIALGRSSGQQPAIQVLLYITKNSIKHQSFAYTQSNDQTVPFQTIPFSISYLFTCKCQTVLLPINWTLSSPTTPGQSGLGNDDNEWLLHIPQISSITGALPSDCLMLYPGGGLTLCRDTVGIFYSPSRLGQ